jgi:hypothetical protein
MTHRLSSDQFQENLDRFADLHASHEGWDTQEGAFDQCYGASCDYVAGGPEGHAHEGEHTRVMQFQGYGGDTSRVHSALRELHPADDYADPANWAHYAAVTETTEGPMAVDWTARQFDASADFPHVTPLEEYSQNWNDAGPDDRH